MLKRILLISLAIIFIVATVVIITVEYQRQPQVLVIADDAQHELQFFTLPKRIVVLEPGVAHLMQQWQRENLVVATTEDLLPLFPTAENLGLRAQVATLQIMATRPDLVFVGAQDAVLTQELRNAGLPAVMVKPNRLDHLLLWPEALGSVLAANQQALQSTRLLEKQLKEFRDGALEQPGAGRRVLWIVDEQFTVAGNNTLEADLLDLVGVRNSAAAYVGYISLEPEDINMMAPDVIIAPGVLLTELQPKVARGQDQLEDQGFPQLVALEPQPTEINWHEVFVRAERLLQYLKPPSFVLEE